MSTQPNLPAATLHQWADALHQHTVYWVHPGQRPVDLDDGAVAYGIFKYAALLANYASDRDMWVQLSNEPLERRAALVRSACRHVMALVASSTSRTAAFLEIELPEFDEIFELGTMLVERDNVENAMLAVQAVMFSLCRQTDVTNQASLSLDHELRRSVFDAHDAMSVWDDCFLSHPNDLPGIADQIRERTAWVSSKLPPSDWWWHVSIDSPLDLEEFRIAFQDARRTLQSVPVP